MAWKRKTVLLCAGLCLLAAPKPVLGSGEETEQVRGLTGEFGGTLVVYQRAEPKTLNPLFGFDASSREAIGRLNADLITINRGTLGAEPGLAKAWTVSRDGRVYTLKLRRGLKFSDGQPFTADDVVFSFRAYLDPKLGAPQRDLLVVGGQPLKVEKVDEATVRITLGAPYAAAERLFDSLAVLPRHLLEGVYERGGLGSAWPLNAPPGTVAGMGPFRLKQYVPGQKLVFERNPYYWRVDGQGRRLPYLDTLEFRFAGSEDAQVLRLLNGDSGMVSGMGARNFAFLAGEERARGMQLVDAGPGLEYNFLFFNLKPAEAGAADELRVKQSWFLKDEFRKAVSLAIDREAVVRLVYGGRAQAIWGPVTPGDKMWTDEAIPHPARSIAGARKMLAGAGFRWRGDGTLEDGGGHAVEFTIVVSASNQERNRMATIVQGDLSQLGMKVQVAALEFRAMLDRVMNTHRYEAAIFGLASGDADPNADMNVWLSSGGMHLWNAGQAHPSTNWEQEIDELMRRQMSERDTAKRKQLFDRAQEILAAHEPMICIASPDILAAARAGLKNFHPAVVQPYTLWNADRLYWSRKERGAGGAGPR